MLIFCYIYVFLATEPNRIPLTEAPEAEESRHGLAYKCFLCFEYVYRQFQLFNDEKASNSSDEDISAHPRLEISKVIPDVY